MPQLMNNQQTQDIPDDKKQILSSLLDSNNTSLAGLNNTTSNDTSKGNANPQGIDILNSLISPQKGGAYQEGVNKALKRLGEQHAMEAVQSGISPMDLQNHPVMQQGNFALNPSNQPIQAPSSEQLQTLSNLLSFAPQANQATQVNPNAQVLSGLINRNTTMNAGQPNNNQQPQDNLHFHVDEPKNWFEQVLGNAHIHVDPKSGDITYKPGGWFGSSGGSNANALNEAGAIQQLQGRQPIQPYQQLSQDVDLTKTMITAAARNPDFKAQAINALSQNQTLPGLSVDQTQILAGLKNPGNDKITAADMQVLADMNKKSGILDKFLGNGSKFDSLPDEIKKKYQARFMQIHEGVQRRNQEANAKARVRVLHPDGTAGFIPREQLKDALQAGYKVAG